MLQKWSTRTSIVLLLLCLQHFQTIKTDLFKTGCLLYSDLCDKNEFCHRSRIYSEGICLPDVELSSDEGTKKNSNDYMIDNLQDDEDNQNELTGLNDKEDQLSNLNVKEDQLSDLNAGDEPTDKDDDRMKRCLLNKEYRQNPKYKLYKGFVELNGYKKILMDLCNELDEFQAEITNPVDQFVVVNDEQTDDQSPKFQELDQNELELLTPDNGLDLNSDGQTIDKKMDQKKPGPQFMNDRLRFDFEGYEKNDDSLGDNVDDNQPDLKRFDDKARLDGPRYEMDQRFEAKRFDESRILNKNAMNDEEFDNLNTGIQTKRKFDASLIQPDRKPVEEGPVHVEVNKEKKIQSVEPTSANEESSPFVAVDSSYAYIYFFKYPNDKRSNNRSENEPQITSEEQLLAQDDILARKYFVENLERQMRLPTGSFSNLRWENSESKALSDCVSFPLLKYLIIFDNDEQTCNCKLLIVSFKVNPNIQELNASSVADQVEKYKEGLQKETGLFVIQTGIGDKVKIERKRNCNINLLHTFLNLSLCAVAAILVVLLVIFYQRKECLRQKIYNAACSAPAFVGWFTEKDYTQCNLASKPQKLSKADLEKQALDYQDLCRQRMKTNEQNKKSVHKTGDEMKAVYQASNNSPPAVDKNKTQQKSQTTGTTSTPNDQLISTAMSMDISTGHLILSYMENHLKQNGDKLNKEWSALCNLTTDDYLQSTQNAAKLAPNKNRYPQDSTTWPFDNSRVILNDLESKDQVDYVNASTIIDSDPNPIYIATQGPMKETISDFWQMVWESGSSVIVMLTRLVENGVEQSAKYWPERGSETYLHFEVNLVSEHIWSEQYLVRSLYLKNQLKNETRTVTQFHFTQWPENSVPTSPAPLLEFRRKVNKSYREKSSPIIVHCSDGCNRTGAYCLIDIVLNRLTKGVKEIDLAATLEHLRDQRPGMVKNKETFEFCLRSIAEEVHNLLRSLQK